MPTAWGIRNPQVIRHEDMDQGHSRFAQEPEQRSWSKTVLAYGPEQRGVGACTFICEGAGGGIVSCQLLECSARYSCVEKLPGVRNRYT